MVTPSRSIPWRTMVSMIHRSSGLKKEFFCELPWMEAFSMEITGASSQYRFQTRIMMIPQMAEKKKTVRHPQKEIRGGQRKLWAKAVETPDNKHLVRIPTERNTKVHQDSQAQSEENEFFRRNVVPPERRLPADLRRR